MSEFFLGGVNGPFKYKVSEWSCDLKMAALNEAYRPM